MNAYGRIEGGAGVRQRMTYDFSGLGDFGALPKSNRFDLDCVRASGLAQVRLQLAVLSGNRRGALRELDRLVELDRRLETGDELGDRQALAGLKAHLDEQRQAIAAEKLALMAAVEFPRLAPAERTAEAAIADNQELAVIEDRDFGRKLFYGLLGLLALIVLGTALAFGLPLLATL